MAPRGLYLPVWTFELTGNIPWSGRVIRNKQEVPVSGEKTVSFGNLCVPASRNLSGLLEKALAYFNLSSAPAYDPRYLAGWPAEIYELTMSEASLEARRIAAEQVRKIIQAEFGHVIDLVIHLGDQCRFIQTRAGAGLGYGNQRTWQDRACTHQWPDRVHL